MKKYLLLLLLLFVPFFVKAVEEPKEENELIIEKIEFQEKTDYAEIIEEPTFEGKKINLNIRFNNVNDFIKYKITLKNNTDKEYDINSEQDLTEYVKVGFESLSEDDNILKANSTKEVYFIISYYKEVPVENFIVNNSYITEDVKTIEFNIKDDKVIVEGKNPYTKTTPLIALTILAVSGISTVLLVVKKKKLKVIMIIAVLGIISIPLTIYALEQTSVEIESKIEIKHFSFFFKKEWPENVTIEYLFDEDMTWHDFMESDYNTTTWQESKIKVIFYTHKYQEIEESTNINYFENDKTGISTGIQKWGCNWYQELDSYESLHYLDDYVYTDDLIVNGATYSPWGNMC